MVLTLETTTALHQLIKYVETPLSLASDDHSTLLKEVPIDVGSCNASIWSEADSNELAKSTGVIVPLSLCITKCLKNRVCLQDLALKEA